MKKNKLALQRLCEATEKAKVELSTSMQTDIQLPFLTADASGPKHFNTTITRSKFESLVSNLIERTRKPCMDCLSDASMSASELDEVLLVGGMTRMPKVRDFVSKIFFGKY